MGLRRLLFAATYDRMMAKTEKAGLAAWRQALITHAHGDVIEIGAGTGANIPLYGPSVATLTMTEPYKPMLHRLEKHAAAGTPNTTVLCAPAEDLPFDDNSFDVAVSTLVLCGVDDQPRALRQLRRVLRPGGTLLFLEHVRADDPKLAHKQDRMNRVNQFVVGCDCNRPTLTSIEDAGFTVTSIEHHTMPKSPSFVGPVIIGTATAPVSAVVDATKGSL
jgi:ubiquinone/menaquinone biosynthesis C-methylase UbiE